MSLITIENGSVSYKGLIKGRLIKRYKRFLADVRLETGDIVTAHCANSGSMKMCLMDDAEVYMSYHGNPARKLKFTLEMIKMPDSLVGINTMLPNKIVASAIESGKVAGLTGYSKIKPEITVSKGSRLDLLLTEEGRRDCYVEIKNSTLVENGKASFPDAVTKRGQKHLVELEHLVNKGKRGVIFFLIQRMGVKSFSPADNIDKEYGSLLRRVIENGVEVMAYDCCLDKLSINIDKSVEIIL